MHMSSVKISVIIPSYKPDDYIWDCLNSIYNQTFDKSLFEVILVLNGCNEPWRGHIENWIKEHASLNCILFQTDQGGVSNARNIGLDHAKGEYITFIDDDDYVSPKYLETMYQACDGNSVVLTDSFAFNDENPSCKIETYASHQAYLNCKNIKNCSLFNARAIFNGPWMKLIKSSIFQGERFNTKLSIGEDSMFMFAISKNIKHIIFAPPEALYYRRYRNNSAITKVRPRWFWINNCILMQYFILRYWIKSPFKYNLKFSISRFLAPIKAVIH